MRKVEFSPKTVDLIEKMNFAATAADDARRKNQAIDGEGGLLEAAEKAVKAVNSSIMEDALHELKSMEKRDMFYAYMTDWEIPKFALNKKSGIVVTNINSKDEPLSERISLAALDKACGSARAITADENGKYANYRHMISVFVYNCASAWAKEHGDITVKALPEAIRNFAMSLPAHWTGKKGAPRTSAKELAMQYNDIVKAIAPADFFATVKMRGAECRNVQAGALQYKRAKGNGKWEFVIPNVDVLEEMVIDQIHDRWANRKLVIADSYARKEDESAPGNGDKEADGGTMTDATEPHAPAEKPADAPAA